MTTERKGISVVSTYATDRLVDAETMKIKNEQQGGPALYIVQAFRVLGLKPHVYTGENMLVEILVRDDDEFGRIHEVKLKNLLPEIETESMIVSTLLDEWNLSNANSYKGKLFVDIQGYVRDGSAFGRKKAWGDIKNLAPDIFCLKGNDIEINMLPKEVITDQSQKRMLIITKDSRGVEIYYRDKKFIQKPELMLNPPHTIGAGDTWFANFVVKFMETEDVDLSGRFAIRKTSEFLSSIQ